MVQFLTPEEVRIAVEEIEAPADIIQTYLDDPTSGPILRVYLALTDEKVGGQLSAEDRLYNRYYWFCKYAKAHQAVFGYDAGIEQQQDDILGQADCELDWVIVQQLNETALAE